jgi:hypothetical protein
MSTGVRMGSVVCDEHEADHATAYLVQGLIERYGEPLSPGGRAYIGADVDALLSDVAEECHAPAAALATIRLTWETHREHFLHPTLVVLAMLYPPGMGDELSIEAEGAQIGPPSGGPIH